MIFSRKKLLKGEHYILIALAVSFIFRIPATYFIIAYAVYVCIALKGFEFSRKNIPYIVIIAAPFLLDILFVFNNDSGIVDIIKQTEKRLTYILFPILLIGRRKELDFNHLLKHYATITTLIMCGVFIRFTIVYRDFFYKYLDGRELWEMGYVFAESMGMHAPALNMHMAFVTVILFYFFIQALLNNASTLQKVLKFLLLAVSVFIVLFINTRLAIVNTFIGFLIVVILTVKHTIGIKKTIRYLVITAGLSIGALLIFSIKFDHTLSKFSEVTFKHIDKVRQLDDIPNPEAQIFNSLVTRVSIWDTSLELASKHLLVGVGAADAKEELVAYYQATDQQFLAKYKFPVHNQFIDFLLRFGVLGLLVVILFMGYLFYLSFKTGHPILFFFSVLFLTSNLVDDFMIRFDGIVFSAFWASIFTCYFLAKSSK